MKALAIITMILCIVLSVAGTYTAFNNKKSKEIIGNIVIVFMNCCGAAFSIMYLLGC